jgi:solute carrier family 6 GABA transporter-like protein 1
MLQGEQLRQDLNIIVGTGKNWNIPVFWGPLVKYVSGPILAIVYSFSYPNFINSGTALSGQTNPLHILGFGVGHVVLLIFLAGFMVPRWFDVFIPPTRRNEGHIPYAPMVTQNPDDMNQGAENGQSEVADGGILMEQTTPDSDSLGGDAKKGGQVGADPQTATTTTTTNPQRL